MLKVIELFKEHNTKNDNDFLLGYCIHIIADIYVYKYLWKPYIENYKNQDEKYYTKIYSNNNHIVDYCIYYNKNYRNHIFPIINNAIGIDFLEMINKKDIESIKNNILNIQYNEEPSKKEIKEEYITYKQIMDINDKTVNYVINEFLVNVS
jgi:hypothetical protein